MDRLRVGHFRSPEMVRGRSGIQNPPASIGSSLSMYIAVTEKPTAAGNTWRRRSIHNVATVHKLPSDVLKRYIHPPLNISIFPISDARFILRPPNSWFLTLRFLRRNKKKKKKCVVGLLYGYRSRSFSSALMAITMTASRAHGGCIPSACQPFPTFNYSLKSGHGKDLLYRHHDRCNPYRVAVPTAALHR